ncbi:MAG: hypothetical protein SPD98_07510 [Tractidigestivibacter sp.]|uniref:hypothetical protein n=1 Tax=Tractidigestivibacter sp. TaxID=2847320 RepID=UPI002A7F4891|nr:hypothetical protein [Tractidigestivibacter sp.]MDY4535078.1 hypothetical protein [Tractidigestivibacter sp.]
MKRIDLHLHTMTSPLEEDFEFDSNALMKHIQDNQLDAIAITNHNFFDLQNYVDVKKTVGDSAVVFPGIEVSVKSFHVLVIANPDTADAFSELCQHVPQIDQTDEAGMALETFKDMFGDGSYIVIPHYKKSPKITQAALQQIDSFVSALEVASQKKWSVEHDQVDKPLVIFSDFRCKQDAKRRSGRYTYVSINELTFNALSLAFKDKAKFSISQREDHLELAPGLYASTGLNVVIGKRSTGKTYFLDGINESCDPSDVVYVKQFGIVKDAEENAFKQKLTADESAIKSSYYAPMKNVSTEMENLPSKQSMQKELKDYLDDLIKYAETTALEDEYSKCRIYSEASMPEASAAEEEKVVKAILVLLGDNPLSGDIEEKVGYGPLKDLLKIAIERYKQKKLQVLCINNANAIATQIRSALAKKSSRPACPESPMTRFARRQAYIKRLANLRHVMAKKAIVDQKTLGGKFTRIVSRVPYKNAAALKRAVGATESLSGVLQLDDISFVERILSIDGISDISKAFFDIDVELKNTRGEQVSGGQKAEYLFFKALDSAGGHDMVLIDEPESSFDNPFLSGPIIEELKRIAQKSTVFISTHNNVLGVSIRPDGIVYTCVDDSGNHYVFTGDASSDVLATANGTQRKRSETLLELMEAGEAAYEDRRPYYGLANN